MDTRLNCCILELHVAEVVEGRADTRVPLSSSVREFIDAHDYGAMTSIAKPPVRHPGVQRNALGFTVRDHEGAMYFMKQWHGFDSVHGRMPSVTSGASSANRDLAHLRSGNAAVQLLMERYR